MCGVWSRIAAASAARQLMACAIMSLVKSDAEGKGSEAIGNGRTCPRYTHKADRLQPDFTHPLGDEPHLVLVTGLRDGIRIQRLDPLERIHRKERAGEDDEPYAVHGRVVRPVRGHRGGRPG